MLFLLIDIMDVKFLKISSFLSGVDGFLFPTLECCLKVMAIS